MTPIQTLKDAPIGYKTGGFEVVVASTIKPEPVKGGHLFPFIFKDETGEMVAVIKRKEWIPISRGDVFLARVVEVQATSGLKASLGDKKIFLHEWEISPQGSEPELSPDYGTGNDERNVIGRIKCHLASNMLPESLPFGSQGSNVKRLITASKAVTEFLQTPECKELIKEIKGESG